MVLRKPAPPEDLIPRPLSNTVNNPPYPTTPTTELPPVVPPASAPHDEVYSPSLAKSPAFNLNTLSYAQKQKQEDEFDYSDSDEWDKSDDEGTSPEGIPNPLKIGGGRPLPAAPKATIPDALRAGPPAGVPIKKPTDPIVPDYTGASASSYGAASNGSVGSIPLKTNNPYLRMQTTGQSNFGGESSQQIWGDAPTQTEKYGGPVELPTGQTPTAEFSNMSMNQRSKSFDQPPLIAVDPASPTSPRHDSNASELYDPGMDISSLDAFARSYGLPERPEETGPQRSWQEQQAWEQSERHRKQSELAAAQETALRAEQERKHEEEFHRMEQMNKYTPSVSPFDDEHPPVLPPRRPQEVEHPPVKPPRPIETGIRTTLQLGPESPNTTMTKQRKEHYQIKHIRWYDANERGIRISPILTQNLNGPCPLLALVNALVLSTPAGLETVLIKELRTREQVSLGLLLDLVFEELMSGRRGGAAQELPDVGELYKFLLTLHTGLNVNPMYVQDPGATDGPSTLAPTFSARPGGFENTREMRLYKTFDMPLMHGWLPDPGSEAYIAFDRVAKTYEDAQNVQFQLEELDAKLQAEGLNEDEQRMFTDIHAIKEFLDRWPTQLTEYGLKIMRESVRPGHVGILFRNDHFSTLYKNPQTNQLMTLVTDQGYSTHDEIVWESLIDINGQGSELYSGDFRAIGNNSVPQRQQTQQPVQSLLDIGDDSGWTTVPSRNNRQPSTSSSQPLSGNTTTAVSATEQEDHDLALALQLQEEEDDRHRRSVEERRRRENQLSEDAIAAQNPGRPGHRRTPTRNNENPPSIPPRRNNVQTNRPVSGSDAVPPPTYEEAATSPQYHPPQGHPAAPNAPLRAQQSAYMQNSQGVPVQAMDSTGRRNSRPLGNPQTLPARLGRRQSQGVMAPNGEEKERCVVM
ncbi:hypothetical protein P154DRAFT_519332 [Amniculicola lignicola CBS 123094]|uniref:MINDY deubiquitinase domain-containing protein n=1 Tax=Amniculicola lignicola CBS 123094 TaxID=1392246 RepID=A0A6A5WU51_9PLEO|nr:hypothetical protein P154DRAFT_519332 [Amniculicola lignicola CBS 123094]